MSSQVKKSIFPSYSQISKQIKEQQTKQYTVKLNKINSKLEKFKSSLNFEKEHREIRKKLINQYKRQNLFEKPEHQEFADLAVIKSKKVHKYADSLNQYLENSQEEDNNNYETHLKFRKKALERQLQSYQDKDEIRLKDHCAQQQNLYKNLYKHDVEKINKGNSSRSDQLKENQNRIAHLSENKKKLTQLYLPYVQELGQTNVVKWRVLN